MTVATVIVGVVVVVVIVVWHHYLFPYYETHYASFGTRFRPNWGSVFGFFFGGWYQALIASNFYPLTLSRLSLIRIHGRTSRYCDAGGLRPGPYSSIREHAGGMIAIPSNVGICLSPIRIVPVAKRGHQMRQPCTRSHNLHWSSWVVDSEWRLAAYKLYAAWRTWL